MSAGEQFGQRRPPLSVTIRQILERYPDGQIFKELIQNADDAGATVVQFYVDCRNHGIKNLVKPAFRAYQGPALISANDAMFSEEDWEGIQSLQQSIKADDPFKVGRFGIGFNSVYHLTDVPLIISGGKAAFLEPQEKVWKGETGRSFSLHNLKGTDHLSPFNGIGGFSSQSVSPYKKTLFRFPLRNAPSGLSENLYTVEKVDQLIEALRSEANVLLLFLRSILCIEVYSIDQRGKQSLTFQVKVADHFVRDLKRARKIFLGELTSRHSSKQFNFNNVISFKEKFDISVKESGKRYSSTSRWLVANSVDPSNDAVRAASVKQKVFPWVGAAVDLDNPGNGRIFCFLPMPIETASNLPVHVNGTFTLNDDRRSLKWPGVERRNDPAAEWNKLLVKHVLPECYADLLLEARSELGRKFYKAWPHVDHLDSHWKYILNPLFDALEEEKVILAETWKSGDQWVTPRKAVFVSNKDPKHDEVVENCMLACKVKLSKVPIRVWKALDYIDLSVALVTPKLTRTKLREFPSSYTSLSPKEKHSLLGYCLSDECYDDLHGLQLLPLCNKTFVAFKATFHLPESDFVYLPTAECPRTLLPNMDHRLADVQLSHLLDRVADYKWIQLRKLTVSAMPSLIRQAMPDEWKALNVISFPNLSKFPPEWFKLFWKWVQNKPLYMFASNNILPVVVKDSSKSFGVVKPSPKRILYKQGFQACKDTIISALSKFELFCCPQAEFAYVQHEELANYTYPLDSSGITSAIFQCFNYGKVELTEDEASSLRQILYDRNVAVNTEVCSKLCIFEVASNAPKRPFSVKHLHQKSLLKAPVAVRHSGTLFKTSAFPAEVMFFTDDDYFQVELLKQLNVVFLDEASFLIKHVISCVTNWSIPDKFTDTIMLEVLRNFDALSNQNQDIVALIEKCPFVKTLSGVRKCPTEIFDPKNSAMKQMFAGKKLFPASPYNISKNLRVLRECGLRTSATPQEILDLVYSISVPASGLPCKVDEEKLSQAKAILKYIGKSTFQSESHEMCEMPDKPLSKRSFSKAIKVLSMGRSWLPIKSKRPADYPSVLPWKGQNFESHFFSLNDSMSLSTTCEPSNALLYGSQVYFTEPTVEWDIFSYPEPASCLVDHLQVLVENRKKLSEREMTKIVKKIYSALSKLEEETLSSLSSLEVEKWVYIRSCHTFVSPSEVAFKQNSSFRHNLEPYLHKLPESLSDFSELFKKFGVQEKFSQEQIISVLKAMKYEIGDDCVSITLEDSWSIVMAILNWITKNGKEVCNLENIYVPVESDSRWPDLRRAKKVTYTDNEFMKRFTLTSGGDEKPLLFLHHRVGMNIAECLQLIPLSEELDITGDTFEDTGQYEPLTTRLKNILRDYKDGLTIVKELIQNADDAEATEVNICFDARTHSQDTSKLFFPGMAESHGPALVVHNNKVFTDEDFENITKLASASKKDKHLKIGKFGIGFCSVYHITDVPSFLSRDRLYIFDPTLRHLRNEIKNPALPGKRLRFTTKIIQNSKQLEPYRKLFGFDAHHSYDGTMFRLPFRTAPSELSSKCYTEATAMELLDDICNCSESLILFLQHVQTITFQRVDRKNTSPTTLFTVSKKDFSLPPSLNSNLSAFVIDSKRKLNGRSTSRSKSGETKWLISTHKTSLTGKKAVASVACRLIASGSAGKYALQSQLKGEVFCFLPLAQTTGLPVHISGNFAVINNRRGIWTSDESSSADESEVEWNVFLMEGVITKAYTSMLCGLKSLHQSGHLVDYHFYDLWPLAMKLKQQSPWSRFVVKLYNELEKSTLFFSDIKNEWLSMRVGRVLEEEILSNRGIPECVNSVLHHCKVPVIDLPVAFRTHFELGELLISEKVFIEMFFSKLPTLSNIYASRNDVIRYMLQLYASICDSDSKTCQVLKSNLTTCCVIPCSPDGKTLKKAAELVHPKAPFAKLFDPDEGMFPIEELAKKDLPELAMRKLGLIEKTLPWDYVAERAQTVKSLVNSNSGKGHTRAKLLVKAISQNTDGKPNASLNIDSVEFLPVLSKPSGFPLDWPGKGMALSCGKKMMRTGPKAKMPIVSIAGSQAIFLCEAKLQDKEYPRITARANEILGLLSEPPLSAVLAHFSLIIKKAGTISNDWIGKACELIYDHLNKNEELDRANCDALKKLPCVWTGKEFVSLTHVASDWSVNGPYLYSVPSMLKSNSNLCSLLGIKACFSLLDIRNALMKMKEDFADDPVDRDCQAVVKHLVPLLLEEEGLDDGTVLLPDEAFVLHPAQSLAYHDAPWAPKDDSFTYVNKIITRDLAMTMSVKPVRSKFLDKYESKHGFKGGLPFGQHEELTRRIRNILQDYPLDITLLKELLQNADDAKATKMHVILDKRFHGTSSVPSEEWQDLQGPALLVWNDSIFTEKDIEGIQKLGLGSKRTEADTIGQYGIGFNVVYHITDCPSFITNDKTLCILDPHCRYVPGADALKPGRRFELEEGFWKDFPDLKSAYLRKGLRNLSKQVTGGSLFRFPLRHSKRKLVQSEVSKNPKVVQSEDRLFDDVLAWMKRMKEAMLFLNHVSELKFCVIEEDSRAVQTVIHYRSKMPKANCELLQEACSTFTPSGEHRSCIITYTMSIAEVGKGNGAEEKWLIQQGVGDIHKQDQTWQYLDIVKPRHGIAAPLSPITEKGRFKGLVFCFLPLPSQSTGLPVHVNGHFFLSSTRRDLWTSSDTEIIDDRTRWNRNLIQALSSSYAELLVRARSHYVSSEHQSMHSLLADAESYYALFPTEVHSNNVSLWGRVSRDVFKSLVDKSLSVLSVPQPRSSGLGFVVKWFPANSPSPCDRIYYWSFSNNQHKTIFFILERIGMKITPAHRKFAECFNSTQKLLSLVTQASIFEYYTEHSEFSASAEIPTSIGNTPFKDVASFALFTRFLMNNETGGFPKPPFSHFLLLTADGKLRKFEKKRKVLRSSFFRLFPNSLDSFLHPDLLDVKYSSSSFISISLGSLLSHESSNWVVELLLQIFDHNFPKELKVVAVTANALTLISKDRIKELWKCFEEDKVFNEYLPYILEHWALLLTTANQLFSSSSSIVPIRFDPSAGKKICRIVKTLKMPCLDMDVVTAYNINCPSLLRGKRILSNMHHINFVTPLLSLLSKNDLNAVIDYFKQTIPDSQYDKEVLEQLRSLPLFENINGSYSSLSKKDAYLWPADACPIAYQKWLEGHNAAFIQEKGRWTKLGSSHDFLLCVLHTELLYVNYIFVHFDKMNSDERYSHLEHIRDYLYPTYKTRSSSLPDENTPIEIRDQIERAINFISSLTDLHCIEGKGSALCPISEFCDHTVEVFQVFSKHFRFLPEKYRDEKAWLPFLKQLKLKQKLNQKEFECFCTDTANNHVSDIKRSSEVLVSYLLENKNNWKQEEFLTRVSNIAFVQQMDVPGLTWLTPRTCPVDQMVCLRGSADLSDAALVWTVRPVVNMPLCSDAALLERLGIVTTPTLKDIVANIKNISEKSIYSSSDLFTNYPDNLACSHDHNDLFEIVIMNLSHLEPPMSRDCELRTLSCLPVYHTTAEDERSSKKAVLVKPSVVISASNKDDIIRYHPYLHCLPECLASISRELLESIGVKSKLELCHIQIVLESIFKASGGNELDVNSLECVKQALHSLDSLLRESSTNDENDLSPLYLPNSENRLQDSKTLLYADSTSYRGAQLDLKDLPYSQFSITTADYKHNALDICRALPASVRPQGLSVLCEQVMITDSANEAPSSELAEQLKASFLIPEMPEGIVALIEVCVRKQEDESDLKNFIADYLSNITVTTVLRVKYKIVLRESGTCIGVHDKKFCFIRSEGTSKLYLSTEFNKLAIVYTEVASDLWQKLAKKIQGLSDDSEKNVVKGIQSCLEAKTSRDLADTLSDEFGINFRCETTIQAFKMELGEEVPTCWHHRLDQDPHNVFNPMERVGYEDRDGHIIVAQIAHPVKLKEGENKLLKKYRIYVSKNDEEGSEVGILTLYKFLVGLKRPSFATEAHETKADDQSLALFYEDSEIPALRARLMDQSYSDIKKSICDQLKAIWELLPDMRSTALRRLFLRWHPDKNHDDPDKAEHIFKFLMKQVEHLENNEPLDDYDDEGTLDHSTYYSRSGSRGNYNYQWKYTSPNFNFGRWNTTAGSHGSFSQHERDFFHQNSSQKNNFPFYRRDERDENTRAEGKRWLRQADVDFRILNDNYAMAGSNDGYSHVCFLAHQVAEKALKGGVYALCGMDGRGLVDHNLTRHALALQAVSPDLSSDLTQHSMPLENYYLNTRYPNRWPGSSIPADHYSAYEAQQAQHHAKIILDTVKLMMP